MNKTMITIPVLAMVLAGVAAFFDLKTDVALLKQRVELTETRARVAAALSVGDTSLASRVISKNADTLPDQEVRALVRSVAASEDHRDRERDAQLREALTAFAAQPPAPPPAAPEMTLPEINIRPRLPLKRGPRETNAAPPDAP